MRGIGPIPADIAIIGEFPSAEDLRIGTPFNGQTGGLLNSLLSKAGLLRNSCFLSNVIRERPPNGDPDEWISERKTPPHPTWVRINGKWCDPRVAAGIRVLEAELAEVRPKLVITTGNTPLWVLAGSSGATKWRGSRLQPPEKEYTIVPTLGLESARREESLKNVILMDLRRAKAIYEHKQIPRVYQFTIAPSFSETVSFLTGLLERAESGNLLLSGDLETRTGHIACFGIADSPTRAFCIPFLETNDVNPFYWPAEQEAVIVHLCLQLFAHGNIEWVGQNFLYDCQYFHRFFAGYPVRVSDTMIGHHSIYSNMRKGLDFLSSMYAQDHIYWKDEIKEWDPKIGEKQFWTYNCKDACITWEIWHEIQSEQARNGVSSHFYFQQSLFHPVLRMMNRGIRIDSELKQTMRWELQAAAADRQDKLDYVCGHPLNPKSPQQLKNFFYEDLKLSGIRSMDGDSLTLNSPALATLAGRYPVLRSVFQIIAELRSIGVFLSTFINAELDSDGRMRCSFSIAGPTTFRFSSSENAFGSGMNLQNIPVAAKEKVKGGEYVKLPNVRKLFIPDPGYTFYDMDLDRADMQVVAAEAQLTGDNALRAILDKGLDLHCISAAEIFNIKGIPPDELYEAHPNYKEHRAKITEANRNKTKNGGHATNYGVGDYKLAQTLGISVREAGDFRARWFGVFPGIKRWHLRTEESATRVGFVENRFGARLNVLGRFDLPECLAWVPQSTVAGVINRAFLKIDAAEQRGEISNQVLIQVHDSLAGQFLTEKSDEELEAMRRLARVAVPYEKELIIPVGINTSKISWGHTKGD
jgi:DNA polymerase I-like protein with 3'-5' exonuclease and polymerase domains/uracil-DNA glycosylase